MWVVYVLHRGQQAADAAAAADGDTDGIAAAAAITIATAAAAAEVLVAARAAAVDAAAATPTAAAAASDMHEEVFTVVRTWKPSTRDLERVWHRHLYDLGVAGCGCSSIGDIILSYLYL